MFQIARSTAQVLHAPDAVRVLAPVALHVGVVASGQFLTAGGGAAPFGRPVPDSSGGGRVAAEVEVLCTVSVEVAGGLDVARGAGQALGGADATGAAPLHGRFSTRRRMDEVGVAVVVQVGAEQS